MENTESKERLTEFLSRTRWQANRFLLSKIGSSRHEIKFIFEFDQPFRIDNSKRDDLFGEYKSFNIIHRLVSLSHLGLLCCSNTEPSLREIVVDLTIPDSSPIYFGRETIIREGFGGEPEFGESKTFTFRKSFTRLEDETIDSSQLIVLKPGFILYPFRRLCSSVYLKKVYEKYCKSDNEGRLGLQTLSRSDAREVDDSFHKLSRIINLEIGVILDSDELLVFRWSPKKLTFIEDFYNFGLKNKV